MRSETSVLFEAYRSLSSLYKNPTVFGGIAAGNQNAILAKRLLTLRKEFDLVSWAVLTTKPAIYYKVLSLLYEVEHYLRFEAKVEKRIVAEARLIVASLPSQGSLLRQKVDFTNSETRSLWKAKILCCVNAVESKRPYARMSDLADELRLLEVFVDKNLHRPEDGLPAWTTLAFVRNAQARLARKNQPISYVSERLFSMLKLLDCRVAEIIRDLSSLDEKDRKTASEKDKIIELIDDLVFIKQKHALYSLNVALAAFQSGFLRTAAIACQNARLGFRLHGHAFHALMNDLLLLSIKRARTTRNDKERFQSLKTDVEKILARLGSDKERNPKLYFYALREQTLLQYFCDESSKALLTLKKMERIRPTSSKWRSRIYLLHARVRWRRWTNSASTLRQPEDLAMALEYTEMAFAESSGIDVPIQSYKRITNLLADIRTSREDNLIDTVESLIVYGSVQLSLNNITEAIKSATMVIELSDENNPRLLAMGYLVMAEARLQAGESVMAHQNLVIAKSLEDRIDHKYVKDRRARIEEVIPIDLNLQDLESHEFTKAEDRLLGWFIENRTSKRSVNKVAEELRIDRKRISAYLDRLARTKNRSYGHLVKIRNRHKRKSLSPPRD